MTSRVVLTPSFRRALTRLPEDVVVAALALVYGDLRDNPQRVGTPLLGQLEGQHVARRGDYRVRYRIEQDQIVMLDVRHRRDAYR